MNEDNIPLTATFAYQRNGRLGVTTGAATGTLVADTYVVLPGTVAASHLKGFVANTTLKTLTYTGAEKRDFVIAPSVLVTHAAGAARVVTVGIEVNGTVVSSQALSVANGAVAVAFTASDLVTLKRGDVVRLVVKQAATEAVTVATGSRLAIAA